MRTILLVVGGNLLAFALGIVITVWLMAPGTATTPMTASSAPGGLAKPATQGLGAGAISAAQAQTADNAVPVMPSQTKPDQPSDGPAPSAKQAASPAGAAPQPPPATPPAPAAAAPPSTALAETVTAPSQAAPAPAPPAAVAVVAPPAAPPPSPASASANTPAMAGYVLQLGAFQEAANATRLQAAVRKAGYAAAIVAAKSGEGSWQLVRIGGYPSREAAATAAASLQRDTGIAALIMRPVPR